MDEEELKKGCGKQQGRGLNFYICGDLLMNVLCPTCQARLEGFQKGKLEEKKGEFGDFIKWLDWLINSPKNTWSKQIKTKLEQLQKEIGGNGE